MKTSENFATEILNIFNLTLVSKYTGAKNKCTVKGICGHTWEIIPSNLLCKGNKRECRECKGLVKNYTKWDSNKLKELEQGIKDNLSIEELAIKLSTSTHATNKAIEVYGFSRKEYRLRSGTIPKLLEYIKLNNYSLLTDINTIQNNTCQIEYICDKGHKYSQALFNFNVGHKCGLCSEPISKGQLEILEYIKSILPIDTWIESCNKSIIYPKELDIVLPDLGIAIEYGGNYYHSEEMGKDINYHIDKLNKVEEFGYRLISITDEEWLNKQTIVKSRLSTILHKNSVIYARKCSIEEISYKDISTFCNNNHIQGEVNTSINLGLFINNTLVAIMSFSKARFSKAYEYELVRYCSLLNTTVIGGASKLLNYFEKVYKPTSIGSYSDRRWNTGNLYIKLGFELTSISPPNYRYIKNNKSFSRHTFMKHKLKGLFPSIYSEEKTEKEIMQEAGYLRVYDCGNMVFIKEYKKTTTEM